jgi:DNA-binding CsgD family transcriptional regulator
MVAVTEKCVKKMTLQHQRSQNRINKGFWQTVLDGLHDSILIFTEFGELIHANSNAYSIYHQISQDSEKTHLLLNSVQILCQSLVEYNFYSDDNLIISDEVVINNLEIFRVRVRWLEVEKCHSRYLLVTIENRYESIKNAALAEAKKYHLTQREAEIWCLYRASSTYKQIAEQLYISLNTVKKHMKNIHAKRQIFGVL